MLWSETASRLFCVYLKRHCKVDGETIRKRQKFIAALKLPKISGDILIIAGSLAEGIAVPGQSDADIMVCSSTETCYEEDCAESIDFEKYKPEDTYIADREEPVSKGYTLLRNKSNRDITKSNEDYIKTALQEFESVEVNGSERDIEVTGPAFRLNSYLFNSNIDLKSALDVVASMIGNNGGVDQVCAIPFKSNTILKKWLTRKRRYSFPSEEVKAEISTMSGHVVPVGRKGSELCVHEWRICYTEAEIKLVHSLNEVQLMLYFKLKVFVKNVLTSKDISSYIVKNILFWVVESLHDKYFKHEYFIPLFRISLFALKKCILKNNLPNYMIPERNLLEGKLTQEDSLELVDRLSYWIEKCPIIESEPAMCNFYKTERENGLKDQSQRSDEQNPSTREINEAGNEIFQDMDTILKRLVRSLSNIREGNTDPMLETFEPNEDFWRLMRVATYLFKISFHTRQRDIVDVQTRQQDSVVIYSRQRDILDVQTRQQDIVDIDIRQRDIVDVQTRHRDIVDIDTRQRNIVDVQTRQQDIVDFELD